MTRSSSKHKWEWATSLKQIDDARVEGTVFSAWEEGMLLLYHYVDNDTRLIMIAAGEDVDGKRNLEGLINILIISYSGGLFAACLSGYVFSKTLLKPIKKIADVVHLVTARNLAQRKPCYILSIGYP